MDFAAEVGGEPGVGGVRWWGLGVDGDFVGGGGKRVDIPGLVVDFVEVDAGGEENHWGGGSGAGEVGRGLVGGLYFHLLADSGRGRAVGQTSLKPFQGSERSDYMHLREEASGPTERHHHCRYDHHQ